MSIILLTPVLNLVDITKSKSSAPNTPTLVLTNKREFGLMNMIILLIFILAVGSLSIILFAELNLVNQNISAPNTGLDVINITSVGSKTNTSVELSNKQISEAIEGGDNVGRIASIPKKCLGSALCPD